MSAKENERGDTPGINPKAESANDALSDWDDGTDNDGYHVGKATEKELHKAQAKRDKTHDTGFRGTLHDFTHSWRMLVAVLIIIVAVGAPVLWLKAVSPMMDRGKASSDAIVHKSTAAIVPYPHKWVKTPLNKDSVDANVNSTQLLLKQTDKNIGNTSCLVFHAEGEDNPPHEIQTTIAFDDPKSRDFFIAQKPMLEMAMRDNKAKVQVCALLTDNEYSALALEALGEIDYNNPKNTWTALNDLLKVDVSSLNTGEKKVNAIMNVVNSLPNADDKVTIRKESLVNGSFVQWARVMSNANTVEKIPALWIDDNNLSSSDKFRITNPDAMFNKIQELK